MRIARVFPRKTNATPEDELSFVGFPPDDLQIDVDQIHISVTFTYDFPLVDDLVKSWEKYACVKVGGPALDDPGDDFKPGMYLKPGYVITSRGCPNNCWFCDVHRREGDIRELPITIGNNILDSNILACSDEHIKQVFSMLKCQPNRIYLTGGLEAKRLTDKHIQMLYDLKPKYMFFAYDTPNDLEPLIEAGKKLRYADFTRSHLRCYVLIGYPKDSFKEAENRLHQTWEAGFMPMAMLYKNKNGDENKQWREFQRIFARPALTKIYFRENWL